MDDLISRQAAIDAFYQYPNVNWATLDVMEKINEVPSAQPERGHWIGKPIAGYSTVRCSKCGNVLLENDGKFPYCPYCGTKMDEVEE